MSDAPDRRTVVAGLAAATAAAAAGCDRPTEAAPTEGPPTEAAPSETASTVDASAHPTSAVEPPMTAIRHAERLQGMHWPTDDPFLFCAYHVDHYPEGDERMAPAASLAGRNLGSDFSRKDGWSMYHGEGVPGFPRHPHRGFETLTVARDGYIDHADSLGATARFGKGDAQWMTAGRGIVHAEMFPLRRRDAPNPVEMFQLWINLPANNKMVPPHFAMLWGDEIPEHVHTDGEGRKAVVRTIAGALDGRQPPSPPPHSWASQPDAHVAVWTIDLDDGASWELPAGPEGVNRSLYFFEGAELVVEGQRVPKLVRLVLHPDRPLTVTARGAKAQLLMLQGRPIAEPVAKYGPFVMNTEGELRQAFADYRRTGFGGWPWDRDDPHHPREQDRFAVHADGQKETPV